MEQWIVTGEQLRCLFCSGLAAIEENQQEIDRLNVFPVPDGDTGRNMFLTMAAAVKELDNVNTSNNIGDVGDAVARGSLMGARGNSGVILSQLIRGLTDGLKGKEYVTVQDFADAWYLAVSSAYRAVIKPVEGTILTVAKSFAQGMKEAAAQDYHLEKAMEHAISKGNNTLQLTPEMLPALKKAGVVDSGGKGLLVILEGGLNALQNGGVYDGQNAVSDITDLKSNSDNDMEITAIPEFSTEEDVDYMYCTEFLLKTETGFLLGTDIKAHLHTLGGSLVTGEAGNYIKIHIHTDNPGQVLAYCGEYGTLHDIKIDNMHDQQEANSNNTTNITVDEVEEDLEIGVVAVGVGDGIKELFFNLGAIQVIEGGQTFNPPVEEFVQAIEGTHARQVLVLPNNKNLFLAAQQAKQLVERPIEVIPSTNVLEGINALLVFNDSMPLDENKDRMLLQLDQIKTAEITYAVRDAELGGQKIKEGELIGIYQGEIMSTGLSQEDVVLNLLEKMVDEEDELITIYSGEDVVPETVERIKNKINVIYPELEVDTHHGDQPIYYFLIGVE
ncbi:MAG TPA: dihydroxyacetone kinase [Peptococcaceae bacterium]|nr:dihydroxyacetone kinase [Peptococcaceae bacterium]